MLDKVLLFRMDIVMIVCNFRKYLALCGLLCGMPAHAGVITVYSNTFETETLGVMATGGTFASGITGAWSGTGNVTSTEGYSAYGFGSKYLFNNASGVNAPAATLTLNNLPTHTSVTLLVHFAAIDSWDGYGSCGPDTFNINLGGSTVFSNDFGNVFTGECGAHPQHYGTSNAIVLPTASAHLAQTNYWTDSAYNLGADPALSNITHSSSSLIFSFNAGGTGGNAFQGNGDESWAIDNITVLLNGTIDPVVVPEPGSLALLGMGVFTLLANRRRRQRG